MKGIIWNPFLHLIIEVKREYEKKTGRACTYEIIEPRMNKTCVNRWIDEIEDVNLSRKFSGISLQQYKNFVIAHYKDLFIAEDENGNLIKYSGFFDLHDGLYMECRGVVVDVEKEELVLAPFRKFMNLNELPCVNTETVTEMIKKAKCVEFSNKLDGSMISAGWYEHDLVVAGSSSNNPEVSVQVENSINYIKQNEAYLRMIKDHPNETHIFEHIFSRIDPHIVTYEQSGLYLTGIRDLCTGKEYSYHDVLARAKEYGILTTEVFNVSFEQVLKNLDDKFASDAEGFVLNIDGFKIKIKYNDYIFVHRAITNVTSRKSILKAIADGTIDDLISKVPEAFRKKVISQVEDISALLEIIDAKTESYFSAVKGMEKVEAMTWIEKNVPKKYKGMVREKYFGKQPNYILTRSGHYRVLSEIEALCA